MLPLHHEAMKGASDSSRVEGFVNRFLPVSEFSGEFFVNRRAAGKRCKAGEITKSRISLPIACLSPIDLGLRRWDGLGREPILKGS